MSLTAREAAERLGISVRTLYAYVSRGQLTSHPVAGTRSRTYAEADVEALRRRQLLARRPEEAVTGALDWGVPILASRLTLIEGGRLYYRGHDAIRLADDASLEDVAALLWTGEVARSKSLFPADDPDRPYGEGHDRAEVLDGSPRLPLRPFERLQAAIPRLGADDPAAWDLRPEVLPATGARVLRRLAASVAGGRVAAPLGATLAGRWGADPHLVRSALVLCADHELNVSAFTARCVASAGSTLYDVVGGGLAALRGVRHGGHTERAEALLAEAADIGPRRALSDRLRRGEAIPGFGQPLYPDGDPRGKYLLDRLGGAAGDLARDLATAGLELLGEHPTIDLGLAGLGRYLSLPPGTPLALFALGRSVGWIAHAIEQIADGRLIRPRARYEGPRPRD